MSTRLAIGRLGDGTIGLRIAKAGFDANSNPPPAPANLIFDSAWPALLPIHQIGTGTTGGTSTNTYSFPKLGYIPLFSYALKAIGGNGSDGFSPNWACNQQIISQYYQASNGATPFSFLQIWVEDGRVGMTSWTSGKDAGWPTWQLAYVIYKLSGG